MSSRGLLSDIKEKKGNAGKLVLTVVFKEMTEREHILLYVMLLLTQNTTVCDDVKCERVPKGSSSSPGICTRW